MMEDVRHAHHVRRNVLARCHEEDFFHTTTTKMNTIDRRHQSDVLQWIDHIDSMYVSFGVRSVRLPLIPRFMYLCTVIDHR